MQRQVAICFEYDGLLFEEGFRSDLIVDHQVMVELKSIEKLAPVHGKKLLTYLRLSNKRVGLLMNFNSTRLKDGLKAFLRGRPTPLPSVDLPEPAEPG